MNAMETSAQAVLAGLVGEFGVSSESEIPLLLSSVPIGIEVEVSWSAYHPELWKTYFDSGRRTIDKLSQEEHDRLTAECTLEEAVLFPKLQAAKKHIKMFEGSRYWEFCFPPTKNMTIILDIFQVLAVAGLCPFNGPHRMQATLGGLRSSAYAYAALMYLELRYGSFERMLHGFEGKGGWAIKGKAGIYHKERRDLQFGYKDGIELRPLVLPENLERVHAMMVDLSKLSGFLLRHQSGEKVPELLGLNTSMAEMLQAHGLEYRLWKNPDQERHVWEKFACEFPSMQAELKSLAEYLAP